MVQSLTSIIVLSHHPIENAKNIYTIRDKDTFTRRLRRLLWLRAYGTYLAGREFYRMITAEDFISVYFVWFEVFGNLQNKKTHIIWHRKLLGEKGHQNIPSRSSCFRADGNNSHFADCQDFSSPKCFAYLQLLQTEIKRGWCLYCITIVQRQSCSSKWPLCSFKLFPHVLLRMTRVLPCSASSVCSERKLDYISMQWLHSQDYLVSPFIFPVSTFPL